MTDYFWLYLTAILSATILMSGFLWYLIQMLRVSQLERQGYLLMVERLSEKCMVMVDHRLQNVIALSGQERTEQLRVANPATPPKDDLLFSTEIPGV